MFPAIAVVVLVEIISSLTAASGRMQSKERRFAGMTVLVCYVVIYLRFMLFTRVVTTWKPLLLLEPFWSYRNSMSLDWSGLRVTDHGLFDQIIINYLLYFPFACLLPFTWPERFFECGWHRGLLLVMGVSFVCSFATEAAQYVMKVGYFEIDDLINNTLGAGIGYLSYNACHTIELYLLSIRKTL